MVEAFALTKPADTTLSAAPAQHHGSLHFKRVTDDKRHQLV
jgi:hypothetical protein